MHHAVAPDHHQGLHLVGDGLPGEVLCLVGVASGEVADDVPRVAQPPDHEPGGAGAEGPPRGRVGENGDLGGHVETLARSDVRRTDRRGYSGEAVSSSSSASVRAPLRRSSSRATTSERITSTSIGTASMSIE